MDENINPYELLGLGNGVESTEAEIKKAYKKKALEKHPDKNPNAKPEEFLQIQQAYDLLCDEAAKKALDGLLRAQAAREERLAHQSEKRRKMRTDLERKERESLQQHESEARLKANLKAELDRLRKKLEKSQSERVPHTQPSTSHTNAVDRQHSAELSRIVKLTWHGECGFSEGELRALFAGLGSIQSIVIKLHKGKKKKGKQAKGGGSALLVMGSREQGESVVRHVESNGGLGFDGFSASLMLSSDKAPNEADKLSNFQSSGSFPSGTAWEKSSAARDQKPINLKSMEDAILAKMKRKKATNG